MTQNKRISICEYSPYNTLFKESFRIKKYTLPNFAIQTQITISKSWDFLGIKTAFGCP
jgi:hypothetical protein